MTQQHDHEPEAELLEEAADPSPVPTGMIGLLGAVLLVVSLLVLTALYYNVKARQIGDVVVTPASEEILELRTAQRALLEGPPRWVERDEQGRTVRALVIPVERAMELVVQEGGR